jgi:hypothetical protein
MKGYRHKTEEHQKPINWKKVGIIFACVLFAVVMIFAGMGTTWLNALKDAKPGNTAIIDFTFRDDQNRPIVTTNSNIQESGILAGNIVFKTTQISIPVNISSNTDLETIPVSHPNIPGLVYFGLTGDEINAIRLGVTGMKVSEDRTISIPETEGMVGTINMATMDDQFKQQLEAAVPGDQIIMPFTKNTDGSTDNITEEAYYRTGTLVSKEGDNAIINYRYPKVDVRLTQLNN